MMMMMMMMTMTMVMMMMMMMMDENGTGSEKQLAADKIYLMVGSRDRSLSPRRGAPTQYSASSIFANHLCSWGHLSKSVMISCLFFWSARILYVPSEASQCAHFFHLYCHLENA